MKCLRVSVYFVYAALAAGCASAGKGGLWPAPARLEVWRNPAPLAARAEAVAALRTLAPSLTGERKTLALFEPDPEGVRFLVRWTETEKGERFVPAKGNYQAGGNSVSAAGGTYEPYEESVDKEERLRVLYRDVSGVRSFADGVFCLEADSLPEPLCLRSPAKDVPEAFGRALATLAPARKRPGLSARDLTKKQAAALGLESGVLVASVARSGPAERAGVQDLDVILEVDGVLVADAKAFRARLAAASERPVALKLLRREGGNALPEASLKRLEVSVHPE